MKKTMWQAAVCAAALAVGCSNLKEPATQAVATAESSLAAVKDAAARYAPEALASVETQVKTLKDDLAAGNYQGVVTAVPGVTAAIGKLGDTVAEKKAALESAIATATGQWNSLGSELPQMIAALQSRVDILSQSKKLPANIAPAAFQSAKSGLDAIKAGWAEASGAFTSGNVMDAVAKAQAAKEKGAEVMRTLGMTAG
ncbi:MAG: hypothetical protein WDO72_17735 [Pseudomonadota bacterium]